MYMYVYRRCYYCPSCWYTYDPCHSNHTHTPTHKYIYINTKNTHAYRHGDCQHIDQRPPDRKPLGKGRHRVRAEPRRQIEAAHDIERLGPVVERKRLPWLEPQLFIIMGAVCQLWVQPAQPPPPRRVAEDSRVRTVVVNGAAAGARDRRAVGLVLRLL